MKIDLLRGSKSICTAGVDELARRAVVRVIANILHKQIGVSANFPLHDKRRVGDRVALLTRKPELREHATEAPTPSDLPRPRKLDIRIILVTGNATRAGGEAQTSCRGEHNIAGKRSKLNLDGRHDIRKPSRTTTVNGTEIVRQIDEELSAMGYPQPNSRIRAVDASRNAARNQIDPILRLQAAGRDDDTGVGYIRPICLDLALAIRAIFRRRDLDNLPPQRDEQKREYKCGTKGIGSKQFTALCWTQNLDLRRNRRL